MSTKPETPTVESGLSEKANYLLALGKLIKLRRKAIGMSQRDLAGKIGFSQSAAAKVELGTYQISFHYLGKLRLVLKISGEELLDPVMALNKESMTSEEIISDLLRMAPSKPIARFTLEEIVDELRRRKIEATFVFK